MKNLYIAAIACLLFASCKEKPVEIDFGIIKPYDTTYLDNGTATAQERTVLIEEFTGIKCVNCPAGHEKLAAIKNDLGARVVMLSIQPGGKLPGLTLAYKDLTKHDNTTDDGGKLFDFLTGAGTLPVASFDRVPVSGAILQSATPTWPGLANNRVPLASPVNISLTTTFDAGKREVAIHVKALYTTAVTAQQYLTVSIKEDGVIDAQENPTGIDTFYVNNNLLRDIITPFGGQRILQAYPTIEKGRTYESVMLYTVPADWKPENCKIVVCISKNEGGDKEVEQAAEAKLIP